MPFNSEFSRPSHLEAPQLGTGPENVDLLFDSGEVLIAGGEIRFAIGGGRVGEAKKQGHLRRGRGGRGR